MSYADDVVLTARTLPSLSGALQELDRAAGKFGVRMNPEKTKYMKSYRSQQSNKESVRLMNYEFSKISEFKYLGSIVTEKNEVGVDIKTRLTAGY